MSDDIVIRLERQHWCDEDDCNIALIAADEIERLRAQVAKWKWHATDLWRALEVQKNMDFYTETAKGALDRYDKAVRGE